MCVPQARWEMKCKLSFPLTWFGLKNPALCSPGLGALSVNTVWVPGDPGGGAPLHPKQIPPSFSFFTPLIHLNAPSAFSQPPLHHLIHSGRWVRGNRLGTAIKPV